MKGFSLIEVLVSMALVATCAVGLAGLFAVSSRTTQESRIDTVATFAAEAKMAELRALPWAFDPANGHLVFDPGLAVSPQSSLNANVAGFVDFLNSAGVVVGSGVEPPREGVYLRRWSIQPLPSSPADALVLQVVAARVTAPQSRDAHLVAILARTAQ